MTMACAPCEREAALYRPAPEFAGVSGLSDDLALATATTPVGIGMSAAALAQGSLMGAIVGGVAASSWKGAGTGALFAGGLVGAGAGAALLVASSSNQALRAGGALGLVAGLVMAGFGVKRSLRRQK